MSLSAAMRMTAWPGADKRHMPDQRAIVEPQPTGKHSLNDRQSASSASYAVAAEAASSGVPRMHLTPSQRLMRMNAAQRGLSREPLARLTIEIEPGQEA
jgi:hypothetical protein